jgi:hypothetical protein
MDAIRVGLDPPQVQVSEPSYSKTKCKKRTKPTSQRHISVAVELPFLVLQFTLVRPYTHNGQQKPSKNNKNTAERQREKKKGRRTFNSQHATLPLPFCFN